MCMDDRGQLKMVMVTCYASGRWERINPGEMSTEPVINSN